MADHASGSDGPAPTMAERFRVISAQAHVTNVGRVDELAGAVEQLGAGTLTDEDRSRAADVAHKLAGSAGTFGYRGVSDTAAELEQWLSSAAAADDRPRGWIADLRAGLAAEPDDPDD